jgi:hypothetical protein
MIFGITDLWSIQGKHLISSNMRHDSPCLVDEKSKMAHVFFRVFSFIRSRERNVQTNHFRYSVLPQSWAGSSISQEKDEMAWVTHIISLIMKFHDRKRREGMKRSNKMQEWRRRQCIMKQHEQLEWEIQARMKWEAPLLIRIPSHLKNTNIKKGNLHRNDRPENPRNKIYLGISPHDENAASKKRQNTKSGDDGLWFSCNE